MAITRVNSATITGNGASATAYTTTLGVAAQAGDLLVVTMASNGTHATNGMSFSDAVNGSYTVLKEQQGSSSSSRWMQTFWKVATGAMTSGTVLTATPYASNAASGFTVDIFRGTAGTISGAVVGLSNAAGTTFTTPALGSNAPAGDLVVSHAFAAGGTWTSAPAGYTLGSSSTTTTGTAIAYVLAASGASTYGGTWTISASNSNASETVAYAQGSAGAAAPPRPVRVQRQAVNRAGVY